MMSDNRYNLKKQTESQVTIEIVFILMSKFKLKLNWTN